MNGLVSFCCVLIELEGCKGSVVGTRESDSEGVITGSAVVVGDVVGDVEVSCFALSEVLIGGVSGIEFPGAIGIDGESVNGSTDELIVEV